MKLSELSNDDFEDAMPWQRTPDRLWSRLWSQARWTLWRQHQVLPVETTYCERCGARTFIQRTKTGQVLLTTTEVCSWEGHRG